MDYKISFKQPHKHFVDIELTVENINTAVSYFQIPAWRPGRYELQNYVRNIQKISFFDPKGQQLKFRKVTRERWEVETKGVERLTVRYNCYCRQMDAGGAWLDEHQLYLNFIYCLLYPLGREHERCTVNLELPQDYKIACGLPREQYRLTARNYYQLSDAPMIASPNLIHNSYTVENIPFNLWLEGDVHPDWEKIIADFKKFTEESIKLFGEFPEKDYHFLYQILPYRHYHGVEHSNSTVIVLGPAENFATPFFYENFLGISCHELFHAWNALKIRPAEMMPYDYTKENYFRTGFVIEGITTYYGDLLLVRSGVIAVAQYLNELNTVFQKHFDNFGRFNLSVADSSFDLWIDGYTAGVPNRKVSIYGKGAIVALILDLELRRLTGSQKSMDDVLRLLWKEFGKKNIGYTEEDYRQVADLVAGQSMGDYFEHCIYGVDPLEKRLDDALQYVGCFLQITPSASFSERAYGFQTCTKDSRILIDLIEPGSPADAVLSKDDEIIAINEEKINRKIDQHIVEQPSFKITIMRYGKLLTRELFADGKNYLNRYSIAKKEQASEEERVRFKAWLNQDF